MAEVVGKDADGAELHVGSRVRDEMFGTGTITGKVACAGGGFNVLID